MSAILVVNQLVKQGIPKDKIKISGIQYGDNDKKVVAQLSKKKGQMVVLVDFARLPKTARKPDFWSDHHVNEGTEVEKKYPDGYYKGSKGTEFTEKNLKPLSQWVKDFESMGEFKNASEVKARLKNLNITGDTPEERKRVRKEVIKIDPFIASRVKQKPGKFAYHDFFKSIMAEQKKVSIPEKQRRKELAGRQREQSKVSTGGGTIGRTEFPSEAGHLATTNAQGLADRTTIDAINRVDSANYSSLEDIYMLKKDFQSKGRMERLANITNALVSQIIKGNPSAIQTLIKTSKPSMMSVYMNALKMAKLSGEQAEAIKELSKESPDMEKVNTLRAKLSPEMAKDVKKGGKVGVPSSLEKSQEKAKEDLAKHRTAETTKFKRGGDAVIVQAAAGRGQPGRFLGSLLTKADNTRYPAHMREWGTMMQISLNPELDKEAREKMDLTKVVDDAMTQVKREVGRKWSDWSFGIMKGESGGHKAIATATAFGTIGFLPKKYKAEFQELSDLEKRVKKVGKKFGEMMPSKAKRLEELKELKKKFSSQRDEIKKMVKDRMISIVNKQLKGVKVKPTRSPEEFKGRKTMKEDIVWRVKHWT